MAAVSGLSCLQCGARKPLCEESRILSQNSTSSTNRSCVSSARLALHTVGTSSSLRSRFISPSWSFQDSPALTALPVGRSHGGRRRGGWIVARTDDFEVEDGDLVMDDDEEEVEELEEQERDYEVEYDLPVSEYLVANKDKGDGVVLMEDRMEELGITINEEEFHKLPLHSCDFFIRKVPDVDEDVYDFSEIYWAPKDSEKYAIPTIKGEMPARPIRCNMSFWDSIVVKEEPVDVPRSPYSSSTRQIAKVILVKHFKNRRMDSEQFLLDFQKIYVLDGETKTVEKVAVELDVPNKRKRDRSQEVLVVRDNATTFKIIPAEKRKTADEVIREVQWARTRESMQEYLRGFRDYEVSNWF